MASWRVSTAALPVLVAAGAALKALLLGSAAIAAPSNPFQQVQTPKGTVARAIGDYSRGCLQGGRALPHDGPGYQVMHPERRRFFGHPDLVDFIQQLGASYAEAGHGVLLIGDLSQPRGGKASGGHASHQSGLDVDIWYWHPPKARTRALSAKERRTLGAPSVLNGKAGRIRTAHRAQVAAALRITAEDPRVERVFVHPIIKRELCEATDGPREWLRKVRPWYGHDDHFHVRLACPEDSPECKSQGSVPSGDGCDKLAWWFDEQAQADRRKARSRYRQKVVEQRRWPEACDALIDEGS